MCIRDSHGADGTEEILIANGDPALWICYQASVPAVCGIYGEGNLPEGTLNALLAKGAKKITFAADLDEHGRKAAWSTFQQFMDDPALKNLDPSDELDFVVPQLPRELGEGADLGDLYCWHGGDDDSFRKSLSDLPRLNFTEFGEQFRAEQTVADPLAGLNLFHDEHGEPYAAFDNDNRQHVLKITSTPFRRWLAHRIYTTEGKMPGDEKMRRYLRVLEGRACFEGELIPLNVRVGWHDDAIYYDLGDWRAVGISPNSWEVIDKPPILFRHFPHQQRQAEPQRGGRLDELDCFLNLASPADRLLVRIYLVTALVAGIPRPIIVVYGDQGSGKSFFFRILKMLLDPSSLMTLSPPDNPREFVQLASHHLVVYLDNLSTLPVWLSDAFARLCTGEGLSKRMLYSDDDDVIYAIKHLGGLNGINLVASKPDLLDRSLVFSLESISDEKRRPEAELWQEFDEARPRILGAMFDGLAAAMRELSSLHLKAFPRMADFTRWGCAVSKGLGYGENAFLRAYKANLAQQNQHAVESSPVATALCSFMNSQDEGVGEPSELLKELQSEAEQVGVDTRGQLWPKDVRWLTRRLREVRPNLRRSGIEVDIGRKADERIIRLRRLGENDVTDVIDVIPNRATWPATNDIIDDIKGDVVTDDVIAHQPQNDINDNNDIISASSAISSRSVSYLTDEIPDYPAHPCHNCGCGDYWLRESSIWGRAEWLCSRCHPKPNQETITVKERAISD